MKQEDNRVRITRMLIRDALLKLLQEKPLQQISVRELCALASINRGTFYTHYRDIYDLMNQIEESMFEEFQIILEPMMHEVQSIDLIDMITQIFTYVQANADLCLVTLGSYGDKKLLYRLVALGKEACLRSYCSLNPKADKRRIEYYYTFISSGCIGILEQWLKEGMRLTPQQLAAIVKGFIAGGVPFGQAESSV